MANRVYCSECGQHVPCPPGQKNPPAHKAGPADRLICYGPGRGQSGGLSKHSENRPVTDNRRKEPKGQFKDFGKCAECRKKVLLRRDGRLTTHGNDSTGLKCRGSGRSPVEGRRVTDLMAKGYRLPDPRVTRGGLPSHGKKAGLGRPQHRIAQGRSKSPPAKEMVTCRSAAPSTRPTYRSASCKRRRCAQQPRRFERRPGQPSAESTQRLGWCLQSRPADPSSAKKGRWCRGFHCEQSGGPSDPGWMARVRTSDLSCCRAVFSGNLFCTALS